MPHHQWGLLIVVYLFTGGLGAGCLALSGAAHLVPGDRYRKIARAGAVLAPLLVAFGSGLLVFDLGRPFASWRLFVTAVPVSPMSIGSWLLFGFVPFAALYALLQVRPRFVRVRSSARARIRARNALAIAGIPLGLAVGIYTGVLLGAIPARPFWNTPMVAQLFLFSALSTACALLMLAVRHDAREHRALVRADLVFITLELLVVIPFVIHGELSVQSARDALGLILGGPYTAAFWGGVVALGILAPLVLEAVEMLRTRGDRVSRLSAVAHALAPALILAGGFALRWIFVAAGQDSHIPE